MCRISSNFSWYIQNNLLRNRINNKRFDLTDRNLQIQISSFREISVNLYVALACICAPSYSS